MRLPRDLSGDQLAVLLRRYGYELTCQTGSHMRLTTTREGEHHVTIPRHASLRVGTPGGETSRQVKPQRGPTCQLACPVVRAYGHDTFGFQSSHMPEGLFLNNHKWST